MAPREGGMAEGHNLGETADGRADRGRERDQGRRRERDSAGHAPSDPLSLPGFTSQHHT